MVLVCCAGTASAQNQQLAAGQARVPNLWDASIEELMNIEVVSVSRKQQLLSRTASAVYVITAEEIRRSGSMNVPDLLRRVPGMHVARIDTTTWAVASRGFNGEFSNKMLVMVDGRSVYTPIFGGVYWDNLNVDVEEIERIEVIRGPGGTMWGANAMNGVINIITKHASGTQGTEGSASAGDGGEQRLYVRQGLKLRDKGHLRISASGRRTNPMVDGDGASPEDDFASASAGFRADLHTRKLGEVLIQGNAYRSRGTADFSLPAEQPPYRRNAFNRTDSSGGHVLARISRNEESGGSSTLQFFLSSQDREGTIMSPRALTADVEYQRRNGYGRHDLMWGGGFRLSHTGLESSIAGPIIAQPQKTGLFNSFAQDEVALGEHAHLTLGLKLEHNSYAGAQLQPNIKFAWTPSDQTTVWTSVSRAVRTPTRIERETDAVIGIGRSPFGTLAITWLAADPNYGFEKMWAFETGFRRNIARGLSLDVTTFYQMYDSLAVVAALTPQVDRNRNLVVPLHYTNGSYGESYGIETATTWIPAKGLSLHGSYTFLHLDTRQNRPETIVVEDMGENRYSPHQGNVRVAYDLSSKIELDASVYSSAAISRWSIPSRVRTDARLGWKLRPGWQLSVNGQNLYGDPHRELRSENYTVALYSARQVFATLHWKF